MQKSVTTKISPISSQLLSRLTPVQQIGSLYLKRDDKFTIPGFLTSGGKLRQAITIVEAHLNHIHSNCKSTVALSTPVNGTTGVIVAEVAKYYGLRCVICVGGTTEERLNKLPMMRAALLLGADIQIVSKLGYTSVLAKHLADIQREGALSMTYNYLNVSRYPASYLEPTAKQAKNIPDDLDYLIIPCGSGIQMCGILRGASRYHKNIKNIIGVMVGPDRTKSIRNVFGYGGQDWFSPIRYKMVKYSESSYAVAVKRSIGTLELDEVYEAKAYDWMLNNVPKDARTCLWIVGKHPTIEEVEDFEKCHGHAK